MIPYDEDAVTTKLGGNMFDSLNELIRKWETECRADGFDSEEHPEFIVDCYLKHAEELKALPPALEAECQAAIQEARYKSTSFSHGCYFCGKQGQGKDRHLMLFCDEHRDIHALINAQVAAALRQTIEPLIEEFENLTILGSDEKKAGYETAMRTAVTYLRAAHKKAVDK